MKKILLSILILSVIGLSACDNTKKESLDSSESTKQSTIKSSKDSSMSKISKNKTSVSTISESTSESIEYQASLSDFVGGWVFQIAEIYSLLMVTGQCLLR
jgi:hypothetical protein